MERKLAAIFSTDVKGYSRLMGDDEEATIHTLKTYREVITSLIEQYHGRVVDSPGDNLLAEFASAVDAVKSAVAIQQELKTRNATLDDHRKMEFRIGLNVGDVITDEGRLYGDGVNIAARLEGLADPGGICISGTVYDQIANKLDVPCTYHGEQTVKNIAKPVRAYKVQLDSDGTTPPMRPTQSALRPSEQKRASRPWSKVMLAVVVVLVVSASALVFRTFSPQLLPLLGTQPTDEPPALSLPDKPSIVVLPFDNMSKDPEQDYFSNGITEVLTSDLSRIASLFVIARNTAFTYKGKATNVQDIGKELGVRYALEGSVQKASDQVRVVAQLIDASTGAHLWSERFDRPLTDIFALQDEIVQKIVTTLELQLTLTEQGHLVHETTDNLEAYDSFLRGLEDFYRGTKGTNDRARHLFEKAVALDPQYAEAQAWLGWIYYSDWSTQWSTDSHVLERASILAQKAIALNDSLPTAHALLGTVYARKKQYDQALIESQRAVALDPNDADSYMNQANVLIFAGRPEEALRVAKEAIRLNPSSPPFYLFELGWAYQLTGRYTEAITALKRVLVRNPNYSFAYFSLVGSYLLQWISQLSHDPQDLEHALAAAQQAVTTNNAYFGLNHLSLGYAYLFQKQYEQALAQMEQALTLMPNEAAGYAALAVVLSRMGKPEEALRMVGQALSHKPTIVDHHLASAGIAYYLAGRPEEAIAPLKQYIARYPHILNTHLTLAAAYSEVGKETEAHAEAAEVLRLNPKFSLAVHKERTPIKDPALLERYIAALRQAGLE